MIYKIIEDDKQTELNMCYFDREQDFFYYGGMGGGSIVPKINLVEFLRLYLLICLLKDSIRLVGMATLF
ncbi:hypothetical protein EfmJHP36_32520 (plasmid) [Enterococcus faecium]|nr:hypothetical protein EfmJHP36_32520 [Enterococcus faecium]